MHGVVQVIDLASPLFDQERQPMHPSHLGVIAPPALQPCFRSGEHIDHCQ
jgi:hypothetical protein